MRRFVFGGNWKMNLDLKQATELARALRNGLGSHGPADVIVFPPAPFLLPTSARFSDSLLVVGGQTVHTQSHGAYTGETSASMLKSVGCEAVLIGHSERRSGRAETDLHVSNQLGQALSVSLTPILCVGETLEQRESNQWRATLYRQLTGALRGYTESQLDKLVIAYEPVWAIGTGQTASAAQAQEVHRWIRETLGTLVSPNWAQRTRLQYGGSVKPANARELLSQPDIDGALVGGAALKADDFIAIVRAAPYGSRT